MLFDPSMSIIKAPPPILPNCYIMLFRKLCAIKLKQLTTHSIIGFSFCQIFVWLFSQNICVIQCQKLQRSPITSSIKTNILSLFQTDTDPVQFCQPAPTQSPGSVEPSSSYHLQSRGGDGSRSHHPAAAIQDSSSSSSIIWWQPRAFDLQCLQCAP